mgnify:CR=1 FL=1
MKDRQMTGLDLLRETDPNAWINAVASAATFPWMTLIQTQSTLRFTEQDLVLVLRSSLDS